MLSIQRGVLSALVASVATVSLASAQQVTAIRILANRDDTVSTLVLAEGSTRFFVGFDYETGGGSRITLTLLAPGNLRLYQLSQRYTGSSSATVEITGEAIVQNMAVEVQSLAAASVESLDLAQTQASPGPYIDQVLANSMSITMAASILRGTGLEGQAATTLAALEQAAKVATELAGDAARAPMEEKKAKSAAMVDEVDDLLDRAIEFVERVDSVSGARIPRTEGGTDDESRAYTVTLAVDGRISNSESVWVYGQGMAGDPANKPTAGFGPTVVGQQPTRAAGTPEATQGAQGATQGTPGSGGAPNANQLRAQSATATALATLILPGGLGQPPAGAPVDAPQVPESGQIGESVPPIMSFAEEDQASAPLATWTVPAPPGTVSETGVQSSGRPPADTGGPNLAVLAVGLAVLGAMAFWLKQRL